MSREQDVISLLNVTILFHYLTGVASISGISTGKR